MTEKYRPGDAFWDRWEKKRNGWDVFILLLELTDEDDPNFWQAWSSVYGYETVSIGQLEHDCERL